MFMPLHKLMFHSNLEGLMAIDDFKSNRKNKVCLTKLWKTH